VAERRRFPGETLGDHFVDGPVDAPVGFLPEPLPGELVQVGPALEGAVADEEVVFHVPDVPLVLALGLRPGGATGPGHEAVVTRQIHEARVEVDRAPAGMRQHRTLLVIDQDLARGAPEPLKGADQPPRRRGGAPRRRAGRTVFGCTPNCRAMSQS
jgi:hypothetical protein